jgi:hypothetical protein
MVSVTTTGSRIFESFARTATPKLKPSVSEIIAHWGNWQTYHALNVGIFLVRVQGEQLDAVLLCGQGSPGFEPGLETLVRIQPPQLTIEVRALDGQHIP